MNRSSRRTAAAKMHGWTSGGVAAGSCSCGSFAYFGNVRFLFELDGIEAPRLSRRVSNWEVSTGQRRSITYNWPVVDESVGVREQSIDTASGGFYFVFP